MNEQRDANIQNYVRMEYMARDKITLLLLLQTEVS